MATGADDDVVVSTVRGDVRGMRYPHILNHISTYTIPSIDEVLNLYHEFQSPSDYVLDLEPSYSDSCRPDVRPAQHKDDHDSIVASIARAYAGTNGPEVIGPGSQLYNVRDTYSSGTCTQSRSDDGASSSSHGGSGSHTIHRKGSWESTPSMTDSDDSAYLSTIFEEPEPPELGVDVDIVKPAFRARRQRDIVVSRDTKTKRDGAGMRSNRV
ncbi:hypothetical protein SLS58_001006 [Diplodia intermedia]|uniref:Uncharacterized protein n=1 Tax=Diplodia intermedia TaxID=856260 RepID=A0ABR3U473_9PEZI